MANRSPLIFSVALNVGLLLVAVALGRAPKPAEVAASAPQKPETIVQKVTRTREIQETNQVIALDWKKLESEEYKTYIANLRAVGCPEETIRDIVIADINKLYAQRWRQMNPVREYKYWRHGRSSADDPVREANARTKNRDALLREKRQLVRDLLGVDLAEDGDRYADSSFRGSSADLQGFEFLTPEKRQVVREIRDRFESRSQPILDSRDPDGYLPPASREQLVALQKELEGEMQKSFTPQEWEQFQLNFSGTSQNLRRNLAGFEPSEEEFRRIFAMRKAVDEQFQTADGSDPEVRQRRTEAYRKLDEEIKASMSPERAAAYQLSQDPQYRQALGFANAWDLPKETATAVYSIRQTAEKQLAQLKTLSEAEAQNAAANMRAEIEKSLRAALGEKAYASYLRNQAGWLRGLTERNAAQ